MQHQSHCLVLKCMHVASGPTPLTSHKQQSPQRMHTYTHPALPCKPCSSGPCWLLVSLDCSSDSCSCSAHALTLQDPAGLGSSSWSYNLMTNKTIICSSESQHAATPPYTHLVAKSGPALHTPVATAAMFALCTSAATPADMQGPDCPPLASPVLLSFQCYKRWAGCFSVAVGRQLPCRKHAAAAQPHQAGSQLAPAAQRRHSAFKAV